MNQVTRILAILFAILCVIVATCLGVKKATKNDELSFNNVGSSNTGDYSKNLEGVNIELAPTKSARTEVRAIQDLKSEVDLKYLDSGLVFARFPTDYIPQQGEVAYLEDIGEEEGCIQILHISRGRSPDSSLILFEIDSKLTERLNHGAPIVFTGMLEDGTQVEPALDWPEYVRSLPEPRNQPTIESDRGYAGFRYNERQGSIAIEGVLAGTPAHIAGLKEGDTILSINGESVEDSRDSTVDRFKLNTNDWQEGEYIDIEFQRGNERFELTLELISGSELQTAIDAEQDVPPKSDRAGG